MSSSKSNRPKTMWSRTFTHCPIYYGLITYCSVPYVLSYQEFCRVTHLPYVKPSLVWKEQTNRQRHRLWCL